ncbi:MAG: hypothetical protein M5R40_28265 [Anaerolineae bacterium]|nr:hypothetical protein [Anaerolineae bacterium]
MKTVMDNEDALDSLFIDKPGPDPAPLVARIVHPYIRLVRETGEVLTTDQWRKLNLQGKVLMYLLGRKALSMKEALPESEIEAASPAQIAKDTGLNPDSVRPTLSRLKDDRLVRSDRENNYWVPDYALPRIEEILGDKGENHQ